MGALRVAGAALGVIALGAGSGYAAGHFAVPEAIRNAVAGSPTTSPTTSSTPPPNITPTPTVKPKTPKPNHTPPLKTSGLEYRTRTVVVEDNMRARITVQVPRWWSESRPGDNQVRYTDGTRERYIRIQSGNALVLPPLDAATARVQTLIESVDPEDALKLTAKPAARTMTNQDGAQLETASISYTYIPDDTLKYVIVRWVALPGSPNYGVELAITGLPQDKAALEAILDRATKTVTREDG